jgi:hypothetical protein
MTTDRLNTAIRNWIIENVNGTGKLAQLPILTNGEDGMIDAPFVGVMETGTETVVQGDVVMHGVHEVSLSVMLSTIPVSEEDEGTSVDDHREMAEELFCILSNRSIMDATHDGVSLFDFRAINPTTEAQDGRRVTTYQITAIACISNNSLTF